MDNGGVGLKNFLLFGLLVIFSLSLFNVWRKIEEGKKRLLAVQEEVTQKIKAKEDLEKEIEHKQSLDYLEREARNRLNLIKPGERLVILPPPESTPSMTEMGTSAGVVDSTPNWKKWWKLIFE